jgi:hypothetical protein
LRSHFLGEYNPWSHEECNEHHYQDPNHHYAHDVTAASAYGADNDGASLWKQTRTNDNYEQHATQNELNNN